MSSIDLYISNGTCYANVNVLSGKNFIPCGNAGAGLALQCCNVGDNCLSSNACYNIKCKSAVSYGQLRGLEIVIDDCRWHDILGRLYRLYVRCPSLPSKRRILRSAMGRYSAMRSSDRPLGRMQRTRRIDRAHDTGEVQLRRKNAALQGRAKADRYRKTAC